MASQSFSDRPRALVTGASAGIGLVFAERLAGQGHDLVLVARRRDRLEGLADRLRRQSGVEVEVISADLADERALAKIEDAAADDERLALLVNNAGFGGYKPFVAVEPKVIDDLIGVHIRAVARLTRAALPGMIRRDRGAIVNVASLLALSGAMPPNPLPFRATYAGAKAFIVSFTQALAGELIGSNVQVQACLPGRVLTEFHTSQGIDISKLPPMMSPQDVVTASLAALKLREVVCVPALSEAATGERITEAQAVAMRAAFQPTLAERYAAASASEQKSAGPS
jgi:uncharacterized protein